jgi:hypothetical protein
MANPDYTMSTMSGGHRKPKTNIYTLLLVIALVALLVGCIFLYLEIRRFGGFGTIRGNISAISTPANIQLAHQPLASSRLA